jgi:hypothetical protein
MKKLQLLFIILDIGLVSCSPKIHTYPGGEAGQRENDESSFWEYRNLSLKFHSTIAQEMKGISSSIKYLKKARLPREYLNRLFGNESFSPELLYTTQSGKKWWKNTNYFLVALVYSSSDTLNIFQKKIVTSLFPLISNSALSQRYLENGKSILCHKYSLLKNSRRAYHMASYYVRWNEAQIINIIVIDTDKAELSSDFMYPFHGYVEHLFQ